MIQYQQLYNEGAFQPQIDTIKAALSSKQVLTWEEYYWGTKCLVKHDECESGPNLVIKSLKKAFRSGLSVRTNPQIYQDALKMISTFYGVFGKYEQVINHLLIYIDSLGESAPDWAYHDLIAAQIHTDQIEIMIETPDSFLVDLARNDNLSLTTTGKQKNLFRDFLFCAADFIQENNKVKIGFKRLQDAAEEYGLICSDAWKCFCETIEPKRNTICSSTENISISSCSSNTQKPKDNELPVGSNVVDLFPENEQYDEIGESRTELEKLKKEILELRTQLEDSQHLIVSLQEAISADMAEYLRLQEAYAKGTASETSLKEKVLRLQEKLEKEHKEKGIIDKEYFKLKALLEKTESKLKVDEAEKVKLSAAMREVQREYDELTRKYESARRQIEELSESNEEHAPQISEQSDIPSEIDIIGRSYYYLNILCLDAGKAWLKMKLPKLSKNYMADYFFPGLTNFQANIAAENGWSAIEDFDLSSIIRVIKYNFHRVPTFVPDRDAEEILRDMMEIRNTWGAHYRGDKFSYRQIVDDIYIMSEFIKILDGDEDIVEEMRVFADKLPYQS